MQQRLYIPDFPLNELRDEPINDELTACMRNGSFLNWKNEQET